MTTDRPIEHESAEFPCALINVDAPARAAALHADRMRATGRSIKYKDEQTQNVVLNTSLMHRMQH